MAAPHACLPSPRLAAEIDGVTIDPGALVPPTVPRLLVNEDAGGLMVPLTRATLFIEVFALWDAPVVLCPRTGLGAINHTLLSIEALRRRGIPLLGVAFIGDPDPDNGPIIAEASGAKLLGRLPRLGLLMADTLKSAFDEPFRREDFLTPGNEP